MDALKNRSRAFTEGVMVMVCPVLLAIAFNKVNLKTEGNGFVRGSISPIAAVTLEAGISPFLGLCLSKITADLFPSFSRYLFGASKLLVHLCALLLMALAYGILLLISMGNLLYLSFVIPFAVLTMWRCYLSLRNSPDMDAIMYEGCEGKLENLVDFSASVTAILFLGLEGLALEGQRSSTVQGLDRRLLAASLGLSFVTCVLGVFVMLLGTVPPLIGHNTSSSSMCNVVEILNIVLAIFIAVTVFLITSAALKELAWLVFVPALASFTVWLYMILDDSDGDGDRQDGGEVTKPASLELTKVTFTGFLAVSVLTIGNSSLSSYAQAFMMLTAAAVISGLGWRLLTHGARPSRAVVVAANVASFSAHLCVAAAVVPFATMAVKALK